GAPPARCVAPWVSLPPAGAGWVAAPPAPAAVPVLGFVFLWGGGPPATTVAGVVVLLASMRAMPVVTVLVAKLPFCVACPAQLTYWYVKLAVASYSAGAGLAGIDVTCTWKVMVLVAPAATVPRFTPAAGLAPDWTTALTLKLPGMNVVPGGGGSVKTTFVASTIPVFEIAVV